MGIKHPPIIGYIRDINEDGIYHVMQPVLALKNRWNRLEQHRIIF